MKKIRPPQLALRLEAETPDDAERWCDGATLAYLGGSLHLQLDTDRKTAGLEANVLHLPLPPEATPRQIRDAAGAWLRREAQRLLGTAIARHAARLGIAAPRLTLSFAARGSWVEAEPGCLRCNWRLIEQNEKIIEQTLARAITHLPATPAATQDLFGAFA
ncbi:MAG: DUF45 domain-containing protein [Rhodocyclaceae bacterium]|jgi:hypothetical protein|nr:DUF45 domain-containing protein [Rhodocyclaceae bacterium]